MNYHKITKFDTANGPGIRSVLWVAGCNHRCKGCHNPQTWDETSGTPFTTESLEELLDSVQSSYIAGITLSGGDPLYPNNREAVHNILADFKERYPDKSVWMYTGYLYDDISTLPLLQYVDVLVDGRFVLENRDLTLLYRGSPNQRIIDVTKSRQLGEVILWQRS